MTRLIKCFKILKDYHKELKEQNTVIRNKMTQEQFDNYKKMSLIIAKDRSDEHKDELLSLFLEKYLTFDLTKIDDLDNYCFIVMKNLNIQLGKSLKKDLTIRLTPEIVNQYTGEDIEYNYVYDYELTLEEELRQEAIDYVKKNLKNGEQQLFVLHFEKGISQNYIANKSGICKSTINNKINRIKKEIRDEYEKRMCEL